MALFALTSFGQSLDETFESMSMPEGWIVSNMEEGDYGWGLTSYVDDPVLSGVIPEFTGCGDFAMKSTTGFASGESFEVDNWLISPQTAVAEGDVLNFMVAYDASYNGNGYVSEEDRMWFDVLVSTTGTDKADFTTSVLSICPMNLQNWSNYSIDLSRFAGQAVYIAFRDHGQPSETPMLTNVLYIDNVTINKERISDMSVTAVTSPVSGCRTVQAVTATFGNIGFDVASFTACYQVDDGEIVREEVDRAVAGGSTTDYTFAAQPTLTAGQVHSVKVWAEAAADSNHENDALTVEVTIGDEIPFPFTMTQENAETSFTSSYQRRYMGMVFGWDYYDNETVTGWGYTGMENLSDSYLLSNCIMLPEGIVKLSFRYMSLIGVRLNVWLVTKNGVYDTLGGYADLPMSEDYSRADITLNVPDEDIYTVAIIPEKNFLGQLFLQDICFIEAYDDMQTVSVDSPAFNAMLARDNVPVTASFANLGAKTLQDVRVCYRLDDGDTVDGSIPSIASGDTIRYTFPGDGIDLSRIGNHTLTVWTELEGDGNAENDAFTSKITAYEAREFPFAASFEADEANCDWIRYNPDADLLSWDMMQVIDGNVNYAKDGTWAAYISSAAGVEHNDWLVSPAIRVTQGAARISFYYTTRMSSSSTADDCTLDVYLTKTDNPEEIAQGEPLVRIDVTDKDVMTYRQGYAFVEVPDDGTYYLAFYNGGMGHDIILDDVRFDRREDLGILSASNSQQSGFNLEDNAVTVEIANHGTTERSGVQVSYTVNGGEAVTETVGSNIAPGATVVYTFNRRMSLVEPGTYAVSVEVSDPDDSDTYNNRWSLPEFILYANGTVPYAVDFDTEEQRTMWTPEGSWTVAANMSTSQSAYNGQGGLYHSGNAADGGDWIYSGCIEIPAGTYDFSFFYRTFLNQSNPDLYGQTFAVWLGTACSPEAMTIPVYSAENAIVATKQYQKVLETVEIKQDGAYYIGVQCASTAMLGSLYMDMFSIAESVTAGIEIGTYEHQFADGVEGWYFYNPGSNIAQWELGSEGLYTENTSYFYDNMVDLPGLIVSPAFSLQGDDQINVSLDYRLTVDNIDDLSEDDRKNIRIGVYLADKNVPDAFTAEVLEGTTVSDEMQTANGTFDVAEAGIYYLGILADGQRTAISGTVTTSYDIYAIRVWSRNYSSVLNPAAEGVYIYADNILSIMQDYRVARVFSAGGALVGTWSGDRSIDLGGLASGVYIVSIVGESGVTTGKIYVR